MRPQHAFPNRISDIIGKKRRKRLNPIDIDSNSQADIASKEPAFV
ncbi:hypothetical protein RAM19_06905 [Bartonella apihabitans]|nr:hypothetical protein [Bartonella apihabitans]WLT07857.1 hypothetical protein RAM19_06905 [Bartonella apihabitans]